jgi:hypothetical protein
MPGGVFCGDECFQNMNAFQNRVKHLDQQKKAKLNLGKYVGQAVILIIVVAALYYVFIAQGVRSIGDFVDMFKGMLP